MITLNGNELTSYHWQNGALARDHSQRIAGGTDPNAPFALLPLPARNNTAAVALRLAGRVEVVTVPAAADVQRVFELTGFQDGEVLSGAFGEFTGDTVADFWIAQPRWKNPAGKIVGRLWLIDGTATTGGARSKEASRRCCS